MKSGKTDNIKELKDAKAIQELKYKCKDIDSEFVDIVNDEFWNLIDK